MFKRREVRADFEWVFNTTISGALAFVIALVSCSSTPMVMASVTSSKSSEISPANPEAPLPGNSDTFAAPGKNALNELRTEAEETTGAIFMEPDQVVVKPPVLKALIQLEKNLSPYGLDAGSKNSRAVTFREVITNEIDNNLTIKVEHSDQESQHWQYRSALGGFLPNVTNGLIYQYITGKYASPFGVIASVKNTNLVIPSELDYYFFQGGKVLFGAKQKLHEYKAARFKLSGTINDELLDVSQRYYDLVRNDVLLQIRIKAVETSQALLDRNQIRYENGANTKLDVLQARTQLSKDRQELISQQIARRYAALHLATALNWDPSVDLTPENRLLAKLYLVDPSVNINDLVNAAISNRPELKKYEQLRLAAKDAVKVARSGLFPTVQGSILSGATGAKVSPNSASSTGQTTVATGSLAPGGFSTTSTSATPLATSSTGSQFSMTEVMVLGLNVQWTLGGLGTIDAANVQSAKWQARKAQFEVNYELARVYEEVRDAYLDSIKYENLINETTDAVNSAREQLRVATIRLDEGVGTDLDAVNAQRDYTSALIDKANAIVDFNLAQVSILRSVGKISLDSLTRAIPMKADSLK